MGDSGGPAISGNSVIGIAARVDDCYGGTGVWTRPEGFLDLVDDSFREACASFVDEDGVLHPPDPAPGCPGDNSGSAGGGGAAGSGGVAGSGGEGGTGAIAGSGGDAGGTGVAGQDPGSSGSAGLPSGQSDLQGGDDGGCGATVAGSRCATPARASLWLAALAVLLGIAKRRSARW